MKIKDFFNKDYDYVSYRICADKFGPTFAGSFKIQNGRIISLDGDDYNPEEEVMSYEEWSNDKYQNALTVTVK